MEKKKIKYTVIGQAHLDPVWQWNKSEGYQEVFATFRSALDRMNEFPMVYFISSSAQFYEWVEEMDPVMFKEIQKRVDEGRWTLVGGWWVEADLNCPQGESIVRQGLYAQKYFKEKFNRIAKIGFSPDTFGHPWTLPQLLQGQGMDSYFYMRPEKHEKTDIPAPIFQWQGPDGSTVLAFSILTSYNAHESDIDERLAEYQNRFQKDLPECSDAVILYGVGNHGGGPTIATIKKIRKMKEDEKVPIVFQSLPQYVEKIQQKQDSFPLLYDELQHHARGCYSACADVKQWDRQTTCKLLSAEKLASMATLLSSYKYPANELKSAWKNVLFNQFHDILAGSSIEEAYITVENEYKYAQKIADDVLMKSLHCLATQITTKDSQFLSSLPFIVFNPCSWPVDKYVEFETEMPDISHMEKELASGRNPLYRERPRDKFILRDSSGNSIPFQILPTAASKQEEKPFRCRVLLKTNLPAMGYQVYRLDFKETKTQSDTTYLSVTEKSLENNKIKITFDPETGAISSYYDKENNRQIFQDPAACPIVLKDPDDTWGHNITAYDQILGTFSKAHFKIVEKGPLRCRLQVKSYYAGSSILQDFILYPDSKELECRFKVNWHEKYKVLKISFPTGIEEGTCTYSIPYGFIKRKMNGDEEPGQAWVDVTTSDNSHGFALLNDSKCGYSVKNGDIRLTVFHSTAWSHHEPQVITEKDNCRYMEQGIHEFSYKLVPHDGDWRQGDIVKKSEEFLFSPHTIHATPHPGSLPSQGHFIEADIKNVTVSVVKKAEDEQALVLRCVENHGEPAKGNIILPSMDRTFNIELDPCEIKTILVPFDPQQDICYVNLLEE